MDNKKRKNGEASKINWRKFLKNMVAQMRPKAGIKDLPAKVQGQYILVCALCIIAALISVVLAVRQRNPQLLVGIPIALLIYVFVVLEYFSGFFYLTNQSVEGFVITVPKLTIGGTDFTQKLAQDYKRLFLVIKTDNDVFYKIPCSGNAANVSVGDRIRAYCEAGEIIQISENSFRTPNASLIEVLEEHPETEKEDTIVHE